MVLNLSLIEGGCTLLTTVDGKAPAVVAQPSCEVQCATMVAATSGGVRDSPAGIGRRTHFADTLSLQISPSDLSETRMPVGVLRATHMTSAMCPCSQWIIDGGRNGATHE